MSTKVPAHERDAEHDREHGEHEPALVLPEGAEGDLEHQVVARGAFMRSSTCSAVGSCMLVDDAAVGEEQHPVGVGGGDRVVGDHHDRLARGR